MGQSVRLVRACAPRCRLGIIITDLELKDVLHTVELLLVSAMESAPVNPIDHFPELYPGPVGTH